ncbi:MAG: AI-2E family transporter [Candidatus Paceibacterota bacterium]|jgi:predicted PurR-regulated permease PerM
METDNKGLTINITPGSIFKGLLIILGLWFLYYIKDIVLVVLVSVVIASGIEPLIKWFRKYKLSRIPAAIVTYLGLFGIFAGLFYFFIPSILSEASSFLSSIPQYLETTSLWNPLNIDQGNVTTSQKAVQDISNAINNPQQLAKNATNDQIKSTLESVSKSASFGLGDLIRSIQDIASNVSDGLIKMVSTVFGGLLSFTLIIVLSFYLAVQEDGVAKFLGLISPVRHEKYIVDLWKRSQTKIGYWMQGQMLLGILVAVLVYLGLMVLGVKNALLLAVLAGLLEIIPVFGPVLSAIPGIMTAFVGGGVTLALITTGLYIIIQQFENHLIYPLVVKKIVGVSPILVILSLIIGAKLAGFIGIILSVPIVSTIMEFVDDLERRKHLFWKSREQISENQS